MVEEIKKKRPFKTFSYRGVDLDQLVKVSQNELKRLFPARLRRKLNRGLKRKPQTLLRKLRRAKKEAGALEKPAIVKTHLRNMVILPEMVGSIIGVYNGRVFNQVEVKAEMIGHYLGEFSITYKPVKHGRPGIGATHSSRFIPLKLDSHYITRMDTDLKDRLKTHIEVYQQELELKQQEIKGRYSHIAFGTAGFRGDACQIEHIFFNVGIFSGLRALYLNANVGVMITASHNPIQDNGVKLIDSKGEILHPEWESIAEKFCNDQDITSRIETIDQLIKKYNIDVSNRRSCHVCIGMDNRPSSEALANLVKRGVSIWSKSIDLHDYGILTTPALHYLVGESNKSNRGLLKVEDYYNLLVKAIQESGFVHLETNQGLCVDCANGVGAETMQYLMKQTQFKKLMPNLSLINTGSGTLNKGCGADFVKTHAIPPEEANRLDIRYASLDGDADRIVYFYLQHDLKEGEGYKLNVLDGDRILSLFARYLRIQLEKCNLTDKITFGVIQTPYANGASTRYLTEELGLKVDFTDTGVKNLHKKALEYELAVYFEANGHGTIHVSEEAKNRIGEEYEKTKDENCAHLIHLLNSVNNYIGDAISDMILVEIILQYFNWDIETWHKLYEERPNSLIKSQVADKNLLKTANAGQTCIEPIELQPVIDDIVAQFGEAARCFVRPSGTENVVRIYAEAATQEKSDDLANQVKSRMREFLAP